MSYNVSSAIRTDKVVPGYAVHAHTTQYMYPEMANCPDDSHGNPTEAHGVGNNEFQFDVAQNRCSDGAQRQFEAETMLRPEVVVQGVKNPVNMFFGSGFRVPSTQGLSNTYAVKGSNKQEVIRSFMTDKNRFDNFIHYA
jgi:hypothetical protein